MFCDFNGYPFKLLGDTITLFVSLLFLWEMSNDDDSARKCEDAGRARLGSRCLNSTTRYNFLLHNMFFILLQDVKPFILN